MDKDKEKENPRLDIKGCFSVELSSSEIRGIKTKNDLKELLEAKIKEDGIQRDT